MESLAEDYKLSACGRQPSLFSLLFDLVGLFWVCFLCVFQVKCNSSLGERSYVMPDLRHSFGIVFLDILGTMCHFSLGVG